MLGLQEISRSDFSLSQDVKDTENIHYGSRSRKHVGMVRPCKGKISCYSLDIFLRADGAMNMSV